MVNSLIHCPQCHYQEKYNFRIFVEQASVHGRPLSTEGHVSRTHFLGHRQNIKSGTSPEAGFYSS